MAQTRSRLPLDGSKPDRIVSIQGEQEIGCILAPDVVAVIAEPARAEPWIEELADAVSKGSFVVPRAILDGVMLSEIAAFLSQALETPQLSRALRAGLRDDLLDLAERCAQLTGSERLRFRFFTDNPNGRCSYHIDVVPPGAPTAALIRVYCGARTEYVDPGNVTSWEDFYAWEFTRKRTVLAAADARARSDLASEERALSRLARLDSRPSFLIDPSEVEIVPPDALVACKFVDSQHLLDCTHVRANAARGWIHRSPMSGAVRCVATVNALN
jgi:hypothetical protein